MEPWVLSLGMHMWAGLGLVRMNGKNGETMVVVPSALALWAPTQLPLCVWP